MIVWIIALIVSILLGLFLTLWIMSRAATREAERDRASRPKSRTKSQPHTSQARFSIAKPLRRLFKGTEIDQKTWDEIRDVLITSDMGVELAEELIENVRAELTSKPEPEDILKNLRDQLSQILEGETELNADGQPAVWLIVGVNGSGKTTSIAKLAYEQTQSGKKVTLVAADTFRAAAIDQLEKWSQKIGTGFIKGAPKGDASAIVFDAIEHAKARKADLVMIDTAGRLHTNSNLMSELVKIKKTAEKAGGKVGETLLVIDATTGQNGITQARQFGEAVDVTGIIVSKLDGSARGGIMAAIAKEMNLPIKRVGVGEKLDSLQLFEADKFSSSLITDV